jgi:mannose-6-phosphate isomerase-like protein (cupin superfamily)
MAIKTQFKKIAEPKIFKIDDVPAEDYAGRGTMTRLVGDQHYAHARNMVIQIQNWKKGSGIPYHFHEQREMVLIVLEGKGKELIDGKEYDLEPNTVVFCPAKTKHRSICTEPPLRMIEVYAPTTDFTISVDEKTGAEGSRH